MNYEEFTPIILKFGNEKLIKEWFSCHGEVNEPIGETGICPLHYAVRASLPSAVKALLEIGANIDTEDLNGTTALDEACLWPSYEILCMLIDEGADLESVGCYGSTYLDSLREDGHFDIVKYYQDRQNKIDEELRANNEYYS